ncbi:hypothetical protein OIU84_006069 [Salix udensis]|uniref:K-box domain-containing protein n=1 Tax=Salix udensis TaxID=889485 RepID=A0AAD6JYG1_9ROSI|nr:hypothetical protein OIU84_006069 [Salix udensis]
MTVMEEVKEKVLSVKLLSCPVRVNESPHPSTTTKKIYDQYQKALGTDLWSAQYEKMQEQLRKLKDINHMLKKEIRQRIGEDLNELSIDHLRVLEQDMSEALNGVRGRKYHVIKTQIDIYKKKVRSLEERHRNLWMEYEARLEDPQYGLVDSEGDYESAAALVNGVSNLYICIPPAPRAAPPPAPPPAS